MRYRCLVRAFNRAGGSALLKSDGFTIDDTEPLSGVVVDGLDVHADADFVSVEAQALSATWAGFVDEEHSATDPVPSAFTALISPLLHPFP